MCRDVIVSYYSAARKWMPTDRAAAHIDALIAENEAANNGPSNANRLDAKSATPCVGILGAGLMGVAIAATHRKAGFDVVLIDTSEDALAAAPQRVADELLLQTAGQQPTTAPAASFVASSNPAELAACDFVIETVPETAAIKQAVYDAIAPHLATDAVLTSNTSTIPIGRLATSLARPDRFCGFHFFHPVRNRSLVEIIRGPATSDATLATARRHALAIGKTPLVVGDSPGFVVNRLLNPYLTESLEMLLEGATLTQIERAATDFGMAMGPLRILDEIGLDVTLHGGSTLFQAFPDRVPVSPLLIRMVKKKRLGRKVGCGFFRYDSNASWEGPGREDEETLAMIEHWRRENRTFSDETIQRRLFLGMLLEAIRVVEEGVVRQPGDVDLGVVLGLGFPRSRGGLLYWADQMGPREVLSQLREFQSHGPRFEPPTLLRQMADDDRRFFDV